VQKAGWDPIGEAMSSVQLVTTLATVPQAQVLQEEAQWYAIRVRCQFEKKVALQLENKGIVVFVPTVREVHRWSDRRKIIELPLFPGYGFVRIPVAPGHWLRVLQTHGLIGFVTMNGMPVPIPDKQIENVQLLLINNLACKAYPFIKVGQRVRIRGGCLEGLEGILIEQKHDRTLVVSLDAIQRSLIIRIESYDIEII
jgi:transcription termination/antitermination protein NusG